MSGPPTGRQHRALLALMIALGHLIAGCVSGSLDEMIGPCAPRGAKKPHPRGEHPLSVEVAASAESYIVGDTIKLTVTVANRGHRPVTFFDDGSWRNLDIWPEGGAAEEPWEFPVIKVPMPDGTERIVLLTISLGAISSENTGEAVFTTMQPGESLSHTVKMPAKRTGRWRASARLDSKQNFMVKEHHPMSGRFALKGPEREKAYLDSVQAHSAEEEARGWHWNREARCFQKVDRRARLGEARSADISLIVAEEGRP